MQQRGALYAREYLIGRVAVVDGRGDFAGGGAGGGHRSGVGEDELFPANLMHANTSGAVVLSAWRLIRTASRELNRTVASGPSLCRQGLYADYADEY